VAAVQAGLSVIATKGRSHGVGYVHLGQRNTRDYSPPKARSQDNVMCTGMVRNANEARHAGTGAGPDMSTYGEGKPGVWKVERLGGGQQLGRTWVFDPKPARHGAAVERIARERAFAQPELSAACAEYLGDAYAALLADEVFTRWAHEQDEDENPGPLDQDAGLTATEAPEPPAGPQGPPPGTAPAPAAAGRKTAVSDDDPLEELWKMNLDEDTRAKLDAVHQKLAGARETLAQTAAMPRPPEVSREALAAHTAARWRQVAEEPPRDALGPLLEMLEAGTTISAAEKRFGVKKWQARKWLEWVRLTGAAYVDGERSTARWRLAPPLAEGDAQLAALSLSAALASAHVRPRAYGRRNLSALKDCGSRKLKDRALECTQETTTHSYITKEKPPWHFPFSPLSSAARPSPRLR
jgi:hypothetical protein